ncbi:MAG: tyrosine--tRNA ligase [Candidatus Borkfalkiaceae bacterium]|nr:tyrosine--tRNA ligase [Christensenellaceae bacterium]
MAKSVYDVLKERGFIKQTIYDEDLQKMLAEEKVSFYVGFDPTADSLHIGHYIPIMAMAWMQKFGHTPIALFGGGTGMIGDPSGRTDMRSMMTVETIDHNVECFKKQMSRFIRFDGENAAIIANNKDWLLSLNYVEFLRDIGVYFSVNKMLTAECYKQRLEKGLTFLEFNYMLMQGYDFLKLNDLYGCKLELGGDDQWSNMLAGVDLIRRKKQKDAFCLTCTLLLNSDGKKMGKTQKGALWLDENKCPVYDFYQYFRNVEDCKVAECMRLLTFMDMEEIAELTAYNDERINAAKERLAYEVTKLVHGEEKAEECRRQAKAAFSGDESNMPTFEIPATTTFIPEILTLVKAAPSKGEARRLIEGGAVSVGDKKITAADMTLPCDIVEKGEFVLHKGKKFHVKVVLK